MRNPIDPTDIDTLIGDIYQAGMEQEGWQSILTRILGGIGATAGQLWSPLKPVEAGGMVISHNLDESSRQEYVAHYAQYDLWNQQSIELGLVSNDTAFTDGQLVTADEWRRSVFWNEFMRRQDMFRMCGGIVADGTDAELPIIALVGYRGLRSRPFGRTETAVFRRLLPHLRRSLKLRQRLAHAPHLHAEYALHSLGIAILALNRSAHIRFANPAAERLLGGGEPLRCRNGCLRLIGANEQRRLDELLCHCADKFRSLAPGAPNILALGNGVNRLILNFVPFAATEHSVSTDVVALVFLRRAGDTASLASAELQAAYGLSPAEADLATALITGLSLREHAERRGVAQSTVRTQLNQAMEKVGIARQSDLVRVLLSGHVPINIGR